MIYAVLYTDGELKPNDIVNECKSGKWVPLLFYKPLDSEKKRLVCFKEASVLQNFIRRNTPKKWLQGAVQLTEEDVNWVKEQGWEVEFMDFPRKLFGNKNVEVSFEVLEFQGEEPDVNCIRGKV